MMRSGAPGSLRSATTASMNQRGRESEWKSDECVALSTATGEWRQLTDFGDRATFIARRVSWSSDGRTILAAVAEGDSDIVMLEGLTNVGRE